MSTKTFNNNVKTDILKDKKDKKPKPMKRVLSKDEKNLLKGCKWN